MQAGDVGNGVTKPFISISGIERERDSVGENHREFAGIPTGLGMVMCRPLNNLGAVFFTCSERIDLHFSVWQT